LLALSWNLKVYLSPLPRVTSMLSSIEQHVGIVPGWIVFVVGIVFNAAVFILQSARYDCAKQLEKSCRNMSFRYIVETNDKLDSRNHAAHHGTCEARAPTCAQPC
jgi:hypothetical protein